MFAGDIPQKDPARPCIVMATSGATMTYGDYEAATNRLAHLLRSYGLRPGDHYSVLMENHLWFLPSCGAGERSGLYFTTVNSHLTADEVAYILNDSQSAALITSTQLSGVALAALQSAPNVRLAVCVDGVGSPAPLVDLPAIEATLPVTPIADEELGGTMPYSSGTTGRPKGIFREVERGRPPSDSAQIGAFLIGQQRYREHMVYLSPAPLYHAAPVGATGNTIRSGGTVIVMERFDPEHLLQLIERHRVTHLQVVPTMFVRLLKLPDDVKRRYDLSSLETVVHAAAPCPVPVKEAMIDWWGPIILEYYAASESIGYTQCDSHEWLAHRGTVGRVKLGELHVLDDDLNECEVGVAGTIYFRPPRPLRYWHDEDKTRAASTPDGAMSTVGDVGYVDAEGYLYLTDRKSFMIISGGVNIYPQETENVLITHPKVADAAVFGVPNADLGEEVKAVVQVMPGVDAGPVLVEELTAFCRQSLARHKCPRTIDFIDEMPRLPTGKLLKRVLRDRYWEPR